MKHPRQVKPEASVGVWGQPSLTCALQTSGRGDPSRDIGCARTIPSGSRGDCDLGDSGMSPQGQGPHLVPRQPDDAKE